MLFQHRILNRSNIHTLLNPFQKVIFLVVLVTCLSPSSLVEGGILSSCRSRQTVMAFASSSIPPPPPISMPVWSLSSPLSKTVTTGLTLERYTSMNIVTFATPVSVAPPKLWTVSLYTNTLTRQAFLDSGVAILQLLSPEQKHLVPLLGKRSGYEEDFSKRAACADANYSWIPAVDQSCQYQTDDDELFCTLDLLPRCASYIQLKLLQTMDAGDHELALCQVIGTGEWNEELGQIIFDSTETNLRTNQTPKDTTNTLYTALLRQEGII